MVMSALVIALVAAVVGGFAYWIYRGGRGNQRA